MDGELFGLLGAVILHGGLLWYKIGKLEGKVEGMAESRGCDNTEGEERDHE